MSVLLGIENRRSQSIQGIITIEASVPNIYGYADRRSIYPNVFWQGGKTFFAGYYDNTQAFLNRLFVTQVDHTANHAVFSRDVNNGTATQDLLNHPAPFLILGDNTFYTGQTDPHGAPINIYRPITANDVRDGFELHKRVELNCSYPQPFYKPDGKAAFCVRRTSYSTYVFESDGGFNGNFTSKAITEPATNENRHYNGHAILSGSSNHRYIVINPRNSVGGSYYHAHALIKTSDFITFSNVSGTFSKDITVAPITVSEMANNCTINGDWVNLTTDHFIMGAPRQIHDDFYGIAKKSGTSDFYLFMAKENTVSDAIINIPDLVTSTPPLVYYNGFNLVISAMVDDGLEQRSEIWACDMDGLNFIKKHEAIFNGGGIWHIRLPDNLSEVNGPYAFLQLYDYISETATFGITEDKFRLTA